MEVTTAYAGDWPHVDKSEARIGLGCSRAWPKVNQICWVPWWMYSTSLISIPWAICLEMYGHHKSLMGGQIDGWTAEWMDGQANSYANGVYDIKYICQPGSDYGSLPNHHQIITQRSAGLSMEQIWWNLVWNCSTACQMWPEQRVCDFSDIFKFVLFKKFVLQISLNCVPDFLTNDKSAFVQPSLSLVLGVKPLSKSVTDGYNDGCNTTKLLQVQCCHQLQFHPCWLINW